jgi:uncharacterized membrane protein (UPF0127 family)
MRVPIDILFCDKDWLVVHFIHDLRPGRITRLVWRARRVVELPAGTLPATVTEGDLLMLVA